VTVAGTAGKAYTGAWARRAEVMQTRPALWGGPDPQHSRPDPHPGTSRESFDTTGARLAVTPEGLTSPPNLPILDGSGGQWLVLDQEPLDHSYGIGSGAGLPLRVSMAQNAAGHAQDRGARAGRRYAAPARQDGDVTVGLYQEPVYPVGSPGSVVYQQEADPTTSPNASIRGPGKKVRRTWHRTFWREGWVTDHRPTYTTTAFTAPPAAAVPNGSQYTSPYATAAAVTVRNVTAVMPQLRRNPRPWDEDFTTDGSAQEGAGAGSFGFFSGGL
jgi:hypothetical protein